MLQLLPQVNGPTVDGRHLDDEVLDGQLHVQLGPVVAHLVVVRVAAAAAAAAPGQPDADALHLGHGQRRRRRRRLWRERGEKKKE